MIDADAVRSASVRIETRGPGGAAFKGSGFFVGRGLVLTCAHVLANAPDAGFVVVWGGKEFPCTIKAAAPAAYPASAKLSAGLPDLALLECEAHNAASLLLEGVLPAGAEALVFYGFSKEVDGDVVFHPLRSTADGVVEIEPDWRLVKLDSTRVLAGMSGGAIVSEFSGRVVAVAKRRISTPAAGAYGVPTTLALAKFEAVRAAQETARQAAEARENAQRRVKLPSANVFFFARPSAMQALHDSLREANRAAIVGEANVGKTTLAREFVVDTLDRFVETLWISGVDQPTARRGLLDLASGLGLPFQAFPNDIESAARLVYDEIEQTAKSWLLIVDGVEDISLARKLMPKGSNARVLITSTREDWTALGIRKPVLLRRLAEDEAQSLVVARLGAAGEGAPVADIAASGAGLPGAVEFAAAGALGAKLNTGVYPQSQEALALGPILEKALASRLGGDLLRFLCELADEPFPLAALAYAPGDIRPLAAAETLTVASLAEVDPSGEAIRLGRGVAEAAGKALGEDGKTARRRRARDVMIGLLRREKPHGLSLKLATQFLPHQLHLTENLGGPVEDADVRMVAYVAESLIRIRDPLAAERLLESQRPFVSGARGDRFGVDARMEFLMTLASLKLYMGKGGEAERTLDEAAIVLQSKPASAEKLPADYAEYVGYQLQAERAEALVQRQRFDQAAALLQAATVYFARHERGAADAAKALHSLMTCLMRQRKVAAAVLLLPQIAAAAKDTPRADEIMAQVELWRGIAFIETAGGFPSNMAQLRQAEIHLSRALALAERALPEFDDVIASCCFNLAIVAFRKEEFAVGDFDFAQKLIQRTIAIRRHLFGDQSAKLFSSYLMLGRVQNKLGEASAKTTLRQALALAAHDGQALQAYGELLKLAKADGDSAEEKRLQRLYDAARARIPRTKPRAPHEGESGQERNMAFIAATLALDGPLRAPPDQK